MFDRIDRELRTQYRLGYYPDPAPPQGAYRSIEVRVKGDYTVRYAGILLFRAAWPNDRRGSIALPPTLTNDDKSYLEVAVEAALEGGAILMAEFDQPGEDQL